MDQDSGHRGHGLQLRWFERARRLVAVYSVSPGLSCALAKRLNMEKQPKRQMAITTLDTRLAVESSEALPAMMLAMLPADEPARTHTPDHIVLKNTAMSKYRRIVTSSGGKMLSA
jgi:hypothetical protein